MRAEGEPDHTPIMYCSEEYHVHPIPDPSLSPGHDLSSHLSPLFLRDNKNKHPDRSTFRGSSVHPARYTVCETFRSSSCILTFCVLNVEVE